MSQLSNLHTLERDHRGGAIEVLSIDHTRFSEFITRNILYFSSKVI